MRTALKVILRSGRVAASGSTTSMTWRPLCHGFQQKSFGEKLKPSCQDTPLDGVSTLQDLAGLYQYGRDAPPWASERGQWKQAAAFQVQLTLFGLTEATVYDHIYCFAEDDEIDGFLAESHSCVLSVRKLLRPRVGTEQDVLRHKRCSSGNEVQQTCHFR